MNTYALLEDSMRLKDLILNEIEKNKNRQSSNSFCSLNAIKRLNNMLDIVNHEIKERSRLLKEGKILGKKKIFKTFHYENQGRSEIDLKRKSNILSVELFKTILPGFLNDSFDQSLNLKEEIVINSHFTNKSQCLKISEKASSNDKSLSSEFDFSKINEKNSKTLETILVDNERHNKNFNTQVCNNIKTKSEKVLDKGELSNEIYNECSFVKKNFDKSEKSTENNEFVNFATSFRRNSFDNNSKKSGSCHNLFFYDNPVQSTEIKKRKVLNAETKETHISNTQKSNQNTFSNKNKDKEMELLYAVNGLDMDQEIIDFLN